MYRNLCAQPCKHNQQKNDDEVSLPLPKMLGKGPGVGAAAASHGGEGAPGCQSSRGDAVSRRRLYVADPCAATSSPPSTSLTRDP